MGGIIPACVGVLRAFVFRACFPGHFDAAGSRGVVTGTVLVAVDQWLIITCCAVCRVAVVNRQDQYFCRSIPAGAAGTAFGGASNATSLNAGISNSGQQVDFETIPQFACPPFHRLLNFPLRLKTAILKFPVFFGEISFAAHSSRLKPTCTRPSSDCSAFPNRPTCFFHLEQPPTYRPSKKAILMSGRIPR